MFSKKNVFLCGALLRTWIVPEFGFEYGFSPIPSYVRDKLKMVNSKWQSNMSFEIPHLQNTIIKFNSFNKFYVSKHYREFYVLRRILQFGDRSYCVITYQWEDYLSPHKELGIVIHASCALVAWAVTPYLSSFLLQLVNKLSLSKSLFPIKILGSIQFEFSLENLSYKVDLEFEDEKIVN